MFYFAGAISGRPFSVPLSPLLSRLCRQLLSRGALLIPLLDERCTHCRSDGCYSASFFCSPITTPQSTLSTAPLYGSLTCLSLKRGGTQCRSGGCYSTSFFHIPTRQGKPIWLALFINLLHLCRLCYPLFFVCDRRRNPNLTLFLSSLYCFQFRHFRLLHRLRKPYTFHLF